MFQDLGLGSGNVSPERSGCPSRGGNWEERRKGSWSVLCQNFWWMSGENEGFLVQYWYKERMKSNDRLNESGKMILEKSVSRFNERYI